MLYLLQAQCILAYHYVMGAVRMYSNWAEKRYAHIFSESNAEIFEELDALVSMPTESGATDQAVALLYMLYGVETDTKKWKAAVTRLREQAQVVGKSAHPRRRFLPHIGSFVLVLRSKSLDNWTWLVAALAKPATPCHLWPRMRHPRRRPSLYIVPQKKYRWESGLNTPQSGRLSFLSSIFTPRFCDGASKYVRRSWTGRTGRGRTSPRRESSGTPPAYLSPISSICAVQRPERFWAPTRGPFTRRSAPWKWDLRWTSYVNICCRGIDGHL